MFIPLHDANRLRHIRLQYVTLALIALNVIIYFFTAFQPDEVQVAAVLGLGYTPFYAFGPQTLPDAINLVPEPFTYVTYSFLHGDIFHLGGNMLFLWVFGDNVEDALGHVKYLIFYLLCAIAGAAFHGLVQPDSMTPLIGASGAVAGIISAYLMLHPRVKVWVLAFGRIPLRIPAYIVLALWIALQFLMFFAGGEDRVSWSAHIGGIIAGAILLPLLKRRNVPLFDRQVVTPAAVEVDDSVPKQIPSQPPVPRTPATRWGRQ